MKDNITQAVLDRIKMLSEKRNKLIIAVDGRCASGKTTLAGSIKNNISCNVFHMDDFFLRQEQRTEERFKIPGGNSDRERFCNEVLLPCAKNEPFSYLPFDCHTMSFKAPVTVYPHKINIIEGTYSCHPELAKYYDLTVFLTTTREKQIERIEKRNKSAVNVFVDRWIPLEEQYFDAYNIKENCDMVFMT